jgi:hypothetical protein
MQTLNERIQDLENQLKQLSAKLVDIMENTEEKSISPSTIVGFNDKSKINPTDVKGGKSWKSGNAVLWNSNEEDFPPVNIEPDIPNNSTKSFNKHAHSRFSGGALPIDALEIVEYDYSKNSKGESVSEGNQIQNKHSQLYWKYSPAIATEAATTDSGEKIIVPKIGTVSFIFNSKTKTWGVAALEIDVAKVNFVRRDATGAIMVDANGTPMSSPLFSDSPSKTSMVWDVSGKCWRLYAVYAPDSSQI